MRPSISQARSCKPLLALFMLSCALAGCTASHQQPNVAPKGIPVALMEVPRWSVELAPKPKSPGEDSSAFVFSGSVRQTFPTDMEQYLERVKSRLVSKHGVDLSENFPERGRIIIELHGFEIDYLQTTESLVLDDRSAGGVSGTPTRVATTSTMRTKSHEAIVRFFDLSGKQVWQMTTTYAKKPNKLADEIAKCLKRPAARKP